MNVFAQSSRRPSQVLFAFDEVVRPDVRRIRWAVAYSTRAGCERLIGRITERIGTTAWAEAEKEFITSLDFGLTDPDALELLDSLPNSRVHVANPQAGGRPGFLPGRAYHPKLYLFDSPDRTGYVAGSANLTASALITNTEVVVAGFEQPDDREWTPIWSDLIADTTPLSDALLEEYRANWVAPRRREVEPDPTPDPVAVVRGAQAILGEAIANNEIDAMSYDHFWVEAGSMSSGGSHNQLELPRGANRFFGFNHANYGDDHVTIGHPTLTLRDSRWDNRPLVWHGNNRMERLNLPTRSQGGFDYQHTGVLFRRHPDGFEINALPWSDRATAAWREASDALGSVFRLGERGSRICGLF